MRKACWVFYGLLVAATVNTANATVFFTDGFAYPDGALTTTSGNLWVNHSGTLNQIQVVNEKAVVYTRMGGNQATSPVTPTPTPIDEDVNRAAGSTLTPGDTWYYAAQFSIEDNRTTPGTGTLGTEYFLHFKEAGTFGFRGRLYVTPGSSATNYTLGLSSSSISGSIPATKWASDLTFGQTYAVVVSYTASVNDPRPFLDPPTNTVPNPDFTGPLVPPDGHASLWVNPVNSSSTKVTDTAPPDNVGADLLSPMNSLGLRQGGSGVQQTASPPTSTSSAKINVDVVSIGDDFDQVLAAVGGSPAQDNADFDGDGDIDGADFLTWQRGVGIVGGATLGDGDATGEGDVDGADLAVWEAQFGAATAAAQSIPEPGAMGLAALGALAVVGMVRRRVY